MSDRKTPDRPRIVVAGAGSIGCFVGGLLAAGGLSVSLLARPRIVDAITGARGLTLTDFQGLRQSVAADDLTLSTDPSILRDADVVLVSVKTAATADMAAQIAAHAPKSAVVVSLQNGLDGIAALRTGLPDFDVRAGMVPFNVVPQASAHFHRATSGHIMIGDGTGDIAARLSVEGLPIETASDIEAVQWGKLLMNLNNALNALSGLTLREQLMDRRWRALLADQIAEALAAMKAAGITPKPPTPLPVGLTPALLRLPTWAFSRVAKAAITIDPTARNSMAYDLLQSRPTEIDALQGCVIALGAKHDVPTPVCRAVSDAIKTIEVAQAAGDHSPITPLDPSALRG